MLRRNSTRRASSACLPGIGCPFTRYAAPRAFACSKGMLSNTFEKYHPAHERHDQHLAPRGSATHRPSGRPLTVASEATSLRSSGWKLSIHATAECAGGACGRLAHLEDAHASDRTGAGFNLGRTRPSAGYGQRERNVTRMPGLRQGRQRYRRARARGHSRHDGMRRNDQDDFCCVRNTRGEVQVLPTRWSDRERWS
jgi:hypothetical protein